MKLPAVLLVGSLAANAALFATLSRQPALVAPQYRSYFESKAAREKRVAAEQREARAAAHRRAASEASATAARRARTWAQLSSDDLKTLAQRLLAAGFPAHVVRGVITMEIENRFNRQMAALTTARDNTPYWEPQPMGYSQLAERRNQLSRERVRLMREVLGDDLLGASAADVSASQRETGNLPKAKWDVVKRIAQDYAEMAAEVRAATRGIVLPEDREKFALLEREERADLAAALTPQEQEDYEMRTSQITSRLRQPLAFIDASEEEFKTIFRLYQKYDPQLNPLGSSGGSYSSEMMQKRRDADKQFQADVAAALGNERGAEFARASNYEFQSLAQVAKRENLPPEAAVRAFDLRQSTAEQSQKIGDDNSLTADQKRAALQTLAQDTRANLVATLGPNAGAAYAKSATWLQAIERGTIVRFDGSITMFRSLSSTPAPRP